MFPQFDRGRRAARCSPRAWPPRRARRSARRCSTRPRRSPGPRAGESVVLVRRETTPDDLEGMIAAAGVLTSRGGKTSHAAVVARGMGRTCVCGAEAIDVDADGPAPRGSTGRRDQRGRRALHRRHDRRGLPRRLPVVASPVVDYLEDGLDAALADADDETADLVRAVDRLLRHADRTRRLQVRANADTADDAARARRLGAQGIGLCRTEHMFLGERRSAGRAADPGRGRRRSATPALDGAAAAAARGLRRAARRRWTGCRSRSGCSTRRCTSSCPTAPSWRSGWRVAKARGEADRADERLLAAVERLHESNPMLGLRGVRLGLVVPGLFAMQVRAVAEAAAQRSSARRRPAGGDHGAARGLGDGAAPVRDETDAVARGGRRQRRRRWTSRSAR